MKRYIAKPNTWFDEGTEARPITEFVEAFDDWAMQLRNDFALFEGIRKGILDEETCPISEFLVIEDGQ